MITLNGKKFAESEKEFIDSLFDPSGTCVGYAKRHKKKISLLDHNKEMVGVIANNVLASATKLENGKYWYNYATPSLVGDYASYMQEMDDIKTAIKCE